MTTIVNIVMNAGADYQHDFQIFEDDGIKPRDLTGDVFECQFRETTAKSSRPLISLVMGDGLSITDAKQGLMRMTVSREKTESIRFKYEDIDGVFDIEITDRSNVRKRAVQGDFIISLDSTRSNNRA